MKKEKEIIKPKFAEDPLFSVIIPIYNLPKDVLKRCLISVQDQNYKNLEVVCVLDGPNDELRDVVLPFLDDKRWKLIEIEHAGACAARNAGFRASSGEIVSFTNSDYILKPGTIRLWVDRMQENPECGFAYGGYEYSSQTRWWYESKPFDAWLLDVANYIDCGFPIWRKYVVDWDVDCKSLQDWDFWIRVVKTHKVKGFYLGNNDRSFVAEPPRKGGLSNDSGDNWIERVRYVKRKNGIPERDIVVTSLGAPNHGIEIAKMIEADYRDDTIHKPNTYKALYLIGWYMKPTDDYNGHGALLGYFPKTVKKIVHFVGADIYWLRKFSFESLKTFSGLFRQDGIISLCENEQSQKELASFGIDAKIVPIPPYQDYELKSLPDQFRVGIFLTGKSDFDKYLIQHTLSIVRAMPDVQFAAYGDAGKDEHYPNLVHYGNMGKEEWRNFVYNNSCLLRLVRHDTMPMASNEFMLAGRDVITNIYAPYMDVIDTSGKEPINEWDEFGPGMNEYNWPKTKKAVIQKIREVRDRKLSPSERLLIRDHYLKLLDREKYIQTIRDLAGIQTEVTVNA